MSPLRPILLILLFALPARAQLTWSLVSGNESWPADKRAAIIAAMDAAVTLYNANGYFPKAITANYDSTVSTANGSYTGRINFGGQIGTRTALHEIGHTLGVGTVSAWASNQSGGKWTGSYALNRVKLFDGPSATIGCDTQHFWPYGLNYDTEDGTTNRVRHVKIVSALRRDMGIVTDSDNDGIPNDWEMFHFGNLNQTATGDPDGDSVNNLAEYNADTDPTFAAFQWTGATSSAWTNATNWSSATGPNNGTYFSRINVNNASNNPLIYDASLGNTVLTPPDRGLVIGSGGLGDGAMIITGGSLSTVGSLSPDVIGNSGNTASLTIDGGTFSSDELQLGVNSPGSGTFTLNAGSANIGTLALRFGTGSGTVNLSGGTLTTGIITRTYAGSASLNLDSATIRATADEPAFLEGLSNAFVKSGGVTIDTSTRSITIAQQLKNDPASPGGGLAKSGTGILTLTGSNTYTGSTTINAGILIPEKPAALGADASVASDATLALTGGAIYQETASLTLSGTGQKSATAPTPAVQRGALQSISGNNTWNGAITIASNKTRIGVQDGASLALTGPITEAVPATALVFRAGQNPGDDIVVSNPANSWTGATLAFSSSATGGALKLGADNVLPTTSPLLLAGNGVQGRLDLNGHDQTVAGLTNDTGGSSAIGTGIVTNTGTAPSTLTLAPTTTHTFIGIIQDGSQPIHLVKSGPATQILTAAQAYTGDTTVTAGTLRLGNGTSPANLADAADVIVSPGAMLHLDYVGTDRIGGLWVDGLQLPPGVYSSASGFITGTGTLTVSAGPASADYATWSGRGIHDLSGGPTGDDDEDSIANLLEYVLGGNPRAASSGILPAATASSGNLVFTFRRIHSSTADTTQIFQYGTDLSGWADAPVVASGIVAIQPDTPQAGTDTVTITVPAGASPRVFGRLKVSAESAQP